MKTINKINLILILSITILINGCGVNVIPTLVSKDVSFGIVSVIGLKDESEYTGVQTIDLTSLVKQDELDQINSLTLEEFTLTLSNDYENSVTKSKNIERGMILFYLLDPNLTDDQAKKGMITDAFVGSENKNPKVVQITGTNMELLIVPGVNNKLNVNSAFKINTNDFIKDGKLKIGSMLFKVGRDKFNDDFFTFIASAKTTVQLEL